MGIHEEHNTCEEPTRTATKMRQFLKLRINKCYIVSRKEGRNQLLLNSKSYCVEEMILKILNRCNKKQKKIEFRYLKDH